MNLDEFSKKPRVDEKDEGKHNNGKTTGFKAVAKKATAEYGSKEAGERVAGAVRNKMKAAGKLEEGKMAELDLDIKDKKMSDTEFKVKYKNTRAEMRSKTTTKPAKKKVKEATGDLKFDNMLGKISGNTKPQDFNQDRANKVQAGAENPDKETIDALNKMMYDMHVTMMTANELMKKLTQGR